ncbi:hypothetical protein AKJ43_00175 [candidate division MSBL1 archaeon SCGC-AAA261D19]|uniref:Uncharacterized protein n=1 Tax=candidate division MSBL1 archaeon SCGC-AAA261D19 TaxID=1698273 RepID=A0A133V8S9_9EURY|nr:hypothetical protein AKJ43_00175 [candidate division MSBL1 archaeon SCGC-AAA261D19]
MEKKMIEKVAKASEKRPYIVIALCGLITLFMVYGATQITMSSELEKFLPEEYASVRVTNELENVAGWSTNEIILIEGDNVTKASTIRAIAEFEDTLRRNQEFQTYIKYVRSFPDYIENLRSLSDAELEKSVQSLLFRYEEMSDFVSENQNSALINVQVNSQLSESDLKRGTKALHLHTQSFDENHPTNPRGQKHGHAFNEAGHGSDDEPGQSHFDSGRDCGNNCDSILGL